MATLAEKLAPASRNIDLRAIKTMLPRGWYIEYYDQDGAQDERILLGKYDFALSPGGHIEYSGIGGARRLIDHLTAATGSSERLLDAIQ